MVNRVSSWAIALSKTVLAATLAASFVIVSEASAKGSKHAAIVVDANTGKVLYGSSADEPRHPASLTKMMTLYMLFEAMSAGRISKSTPVPISKHAASMAPTKLGAKAGTSITVETAILGLVTKSANDAAAASGELIGGSEARFAQMMTAKAQALGMRNTRFYNASGLPDPRQITTARDMAVLGIALRSDFPQYYKYFSVRSFTYGRSRLANHNKLLGRVAGVDGIKTGYTRMSGFNLVSSVSLNNKKLVTVVLGGKSGRSRDAEVAGLIQKYLPKASNRASGGLFARLRNKQADVSDEALALADPAPVPEAKKVVALIEPAVASVVPAPAERPIVSVTEEVEANVQPVDPIQTASAPVESPSGNGAWVIQIAAADSQAGAMKILNRAQTAGGKALANVSPFTQEVKKGSALLFRARFGGFDSKEQAWNACEALKRKQYGCFALNN
ncbi:MAG: D-alanyl-D-alanine carboxypeptidase [Rhizobiaceae bacterium]